MGRFGTNRPELRGFANFWAESNLVGRQCSMKDGKSM